MQSRVPQEYDFYQDRQENIRYLSAPWGGFTTRLNTPPEEGDSYKIVKYKLLSLVQGLKPSTEGPEGKLNNFSLDQIKKLRVWVKDLANNFEPKPRKCPLVDGFSYDQYKQAMQEVYKVIQTPKIYASSFSNYVQKSKDQYSGGSPAWKRTIGILSMIAGLVGLVVGCIFLPTGASVLVMFPAVGLSVYGSYKFDQARSAQTRKDLEGISALAEEVQKLPSLSNVLRKR